MSIFSWFVSFIILLIDVVLRNVLWSLFDDPAVSKIRQRRFASLIFSTSSLNAKICILTSEIKKKNVLKYIFRLLVQLLYYNLYYCYGNYYHCYGNFIIICRYYYIYGYYYSKYAESYIQFYNKLLNIKLCMSGNVSQKIFRKLSYMGDFTRNFISQTESLQKKP